MSRFDGRVALVTGASSGAGLAVAQRLAAEGAAVALLARDAARLEAARAHIEQDGGRAIAVQADLGSGVEVESAVAQTVEQLGGLDLLANVAGTLRGGQLPDLSEADWDLLFDAHPKACFLTAKHAIPAMRARGGGAIVNVASIYGVTSDPGYAAYAASKAAVIALTQTMALDHVGEGIRVNGVLPGGMDTPMLHAIAERVSPSNPGAVLEAAGRTHPLGRLIDPREIAGLVCFLLSDEAAAIVGANYAIDGGRLAKLGSAAR